MGEILNLANVALAFIGERHKSNTSVLVLIVDLHEIRRMSYARASPSGEDLEHNHVARKIIGGLAVSPSGNFQRRKSMTGPQRRR